jgi:hypothetical protein
MPGSRSASSPCSSPFTVSSMSSASPSRGGLGGPRGVGYSTLILNRSVEVGDTAVKLLGFVWLAAAFAFVMVAVMIWRGHPWALRSTVALLIGSLVLCVIGLPGAVMGLAIDVVLLVLLAFASEKLVGRPASRAVR